MPSWSRPSAASPSTATTAPRSTTSRPTSASADRACSTTSRPRRRSTTRCSSGAVATGSRAGRGGDRRPPREGWEKVDSCSTRQLRVLRRQPRLRAPDAPGGARGRHATSRIDLGAVAAAVHAAAPRLLPAGDGRRPLPAPRPRATAAHRLRRAAQLLQRRAVPRQPPRPSMPSAADDLARRRQHITSSSGPRSSPRAPEGRAGSDRGATRGACCRPTSVCRRADNGSNAVRSRLQAAARRGRRAHRARGGCRRRRGRVRGGRPARLSRSSSS